MVYYSKRFSPFSSIPRLHAGKPGIEASFQELEGRDLMQVGVVLFSPLSPFSPRGNRRLSNVPALERRMRVVEVLGRWFWESFTVDREGEFGQERAALERQMGPYKIKWHLWVDRRDKSVVGFDV